MTPSPNTGPIVPGWIRDEIARHQETWPRLVLAAGMVGTILMQLLMGILIWTSEVVVYYARP